MKVKKLSQRLSRRTYRIVRGIVRLLAVLLLLLMCAFFFLRTYGVPGPLLRAAVGRANAAGIPIQIESIRLTLHGWKATNIRYYSKCPDDLVPIIQAEEVVFRRTALPENGSAKWVFDVEASGVALAPSVEWGVDIPSSSACRRIEHIKSLVAFLPDSILVRNGTTSWMGVRFEVDGTIRKTRKKEIQAKPELKTLSPVHVTSQQFRRFEGYLQSMEFNGEALVVVDFMIDAGDYAASRIELSAHADDLELRTVAFSLAEISFHYAYPGIQLDLAKLYMNNQTFQIAGEYDLKQDQARLSVFNSITSKRMLLLLPERLMDLMIKSELHFESPPELDLQLGPAQPKNLLNAVSGSFTVRNTAFRHMVVESLSGEVNRKGSRLELTRLQGSLAGQPTRSKETGSGMVGGPARGDFFWDSNAHEFGVSAEGAFDPNLLLEPLTVSRVATNVIQRFQFDNQPPQVHLNLGADYHDWKTFFIDIQCTASDVRVHRVPFSSVNATASYKRGVLTLDPVVAMQGTAFMKGAASLDFHNDTVTFDAQGTLQPEVLEDVIYPHVNLFGNKIRTSGNNNIAAHGRVDWRSMQTTSFNAEVEADRIETPIVALDNFSATVSGSGPIVEVKDAVFNIYSGKGKGKLSMCLDPQTNSIPYVLDCELGDVDFLKCLQFIQPQKKYRVSGKLSSKVHVEADFTRDFFDVANGSGNVDIVDGQLADLPLFRGFSRLIRKIIPSFSVFSIDRLTGSFDLIDGVIHSEDAYFDGDLISAKGHGSYSPRNGFDAIVQAQVLSDNRISKLFRMLTDPILKLFELRLEGPLADPSWRLENLPGGG